MLTRRRVISAVVLVVVLALAWSVWLAVQTARDLRAAQASVSRIEAAITAQDSEARSAAIAELEASVAAAKDRSDGFWWGAMTLTPFVGDDAAGVRALSESLELVTAEALVPLSKSLDELDDIAKDGRVDLAKLTALEGNVVMAHDAFEEASALVSTRDSDGFLGVFRTRYNEYVALVSDLARDLDSAETAIRVLPAMLGAEESRSYLLIFENNAEIRATGGLPGSWALITAEDGQLEMAEQGSATDFEQYSEPIGDITPAELDLYGAEMGRFFQNPSFTPDFPRAAEVFNAFWRERSPEQPIDGVVSLDVVALSYLMGAFGPIDVDGLALTADNLIDQLLSVVYVEPDPAKQDAIFQDVAMTIFAEATSGGDDVVKLFEGMAKAARESRFKVAPFVASDAAILKDAGVLHAFNSDGDSTPRIDFALNDATGSKMSYYLRYSTEIRPTSCEDDVQRFVATMNLSQTINPSDARNLPSYVTGIGNAGTQLGEQVVRVHVFGPSGGGFNGIKINGRAVGVPEPVEVDGRPAVTLAVLLDSMDDVVVSLDMTSARGQTGDVVLRETPSVVPGSSISVYGSACG